MEGCHLHKKKLASGVFHFDWRAGSDSFFVPSLAFGAQTVPASHFLNAIFSKAGGLREVKSFATKIR
ncbi:MAG: hypothetical protein ABW007_00225, partial [Chitinophagaceae bacterium]